MHEQRAPHPSTAPAVRRAASIEALRQIAHRRVPSFAMDYVETGSGDESTLRRNTSVIQCIGLVPRTLVDVSQRSTASDLFGRPVAAPLVIAPTGFNGMLRRGADVMIARAAARMGIPSALSTVSNELLEDVANASLALGGRPWFQLYMMKDRGITEDLLVRAHAAGMETLLLTTDAAVFGLRERELRNYAGPSTLTLRAKLQALRHPQWLIDVMLPNGAPRFANLLRYLAPEHQGWRSGAAFVGGQMDASLEWSSVAWLRERWPGKLLIKGVCSAKDALEARAAGADGVVLTNHGGRQLDGAIAPMECLQDVRQAVGNNFTLIIDSGFRRGSHVVKAIALGADAVMLGRAALYGVAAGGEAGVMKAIEIIQSDIDRTLAHLGVTTLESIGRDQIVLSNGAMHSTA